MNFLMIKLRVMAPGKGLSCIRSGKMHCMEHFGFEARVRPRLYSGS